MPKAQALLIVDKYLQRRINENWTTYWANLPEDERSILSAAGYNKGIWADAIDKPSSLADPAHDPAVWISIIIGGGIAWALPIKSLILINGPTFAEGFTVAEMNILRQSINKAGLNSSGLVFWRGQGAPSSYYASANAGTPNITIYDSFFSTTVNQQTAILQEEYAHLMQVITEYSDDVIKAAEDAAKMLK